MNKHISVLLTEAVEALNIQPDSWYIDTTFGRGGHTQAILARGGKVIAFDQDAEAVDYAQDNFKSYISDIKLIMIHENFNRLKEEIIRLQDTGAVDTISGVLFDFGTSTEQLTSAERGFSFEGDGPLDMRMDTRLGVQAKDLLAVLPEAQLEQLFREYGGEESARGIAKAIKRSTQPVTTVKQLREIILSVKRGYKGKLHPATKVFQALRIAVNVELESINEAFSQAFEVVSAGGRLVTIAFHEGEDRIVKQYIKNWHSLGLVSEPQRIKPSTEEVERNPRSRSAILRIVEKL